MTWKGVILKESLEEKSLLELVKIVEIKKEEYNVEMDDKNRKKIYDGIKRSLT